MIAWLFHTTERLVVVVTGVLTALLVLGITVAALRLGGVPERVQVTGTPVPTPAPAAMADPLPAGVKAAQSFLDQSGDPSTLTGPHVAVKQHAYRTEVRVQTTSGIVIVDLTPDGRNWAVLSADWANPS